MKPKQVTHVNANAPSAPPGTEPMYYDKYDAANYTGLSVETIFYHHYKSGNLKGGIKHFGRIVWTKTQLDEFMRINPERGVVSVNRITAAAFIGQELIKNLDSSDVEYRYKGQRVINVERDFNDTRRYYITTADKFEHQCWNNTRLEVVKKDHD